MLQYVPSPEPPVEAVFHALSDANRRAMIDRLLDGPASVSELARPLSISLPAVVQHLHVLEGCGVVRSQKLGRVRTCEIEPQALSAAERWISERRAIWEQRLDRLGEFLAAQADESATETAVKDRGERDEQAIGNPRDLRDRARPTTPRPRGCSRPGRTQSAKSRNGSGPPSGGEEHELDFRVGGREHFERQRRATALYSYDALYQDIVADERIVYTYDMHRDETRMSRVGRDGRDRSRRATGTHLRYTEQGVFLDGIDTPAGARARHGRAARQTRPGTGRREPAYDAHPTRAPDDRGARAYDERRMALYVLCIGMLMIVLDVTIVNVALPSIQDDLDFSTSSLAWVVNAYLIAFGGLLLLAGRLGDLVGRRRVFLAGVALFTCASLLCGVAQSSARLVGRALRPGRRRRDDLGGDPRDDRDDVPRAARAGQGDRRVRLRGLGRRLGRACSPAAC